MDVFFVELRQAARVLRRNPGFVAAVIVVLAVGIGGTTSIFSVVNGLLLRPIPGIAEPGRLAAVRASEFGGAFGVSSYMDYLDFRERTRAFESMAAFKPRMVDASATGTPEPVGAVMVTSSYFDVLSVAPYVGRYFAAEVDEGVGAHTEVVLTEGLWRRWFGGDPGAIGSEIVLNGLSYTMIGVTPPGFRGTSLVEVPELFVPMTMQPNLMPSSGYLLDRRGWGGVLIVGRLAGDATVAIAAAEMEALGGQLAAEYPQTNESRAYTALGFREAAMPGDARAPIVRMSVLLLAVVAALWLVVCLNVANLFLARSIKRRGELAVRLAMGAGRRRVTGQLVLEFMMLALVAGAFGVLIARTVAGAVQTLPLPIAFDVGVDVRTALFAGGVAVVSGLLCALVPAATMSGIDPRSAASPAPGMKPRRQRWPSRVLVVSQVTLSVVLLFTTGLFVRTFTNLTTADPGFDADNLLTARFDPSLQGYDVQRIGDFYERLTEAAATLPGVEGVAMADVLPAASNYGVDNWFFENAEDRAQGSSVSMSVVSPEFFSMLGIPVVSGRAFEMDAPPDQPLVVIVNEAGARLVESRTGMDAMGQGITVAGPDGPFFEIIGVVGDSRTGRDGQAPPMVYVSHAQATALGFGDAMVVLLKTSLPASAIAPELRRVAAEVDANVSASNVITMSRFLDDLLVADRLTVTVLGVSSLLALLLVAIGLYGLLAYLVTQRTREFGIRLALGAAAANLKSIVLREALALSAVGLLLGLAGAFAAARLTSSFLVGVSATDPASLAASLTTVVGVALAAAYVPAARAMRADPATAMRTE